MPTLDPAAFAREYASCASLPELARKLGVRPNALAKRASRLRRAGYDVPLKRGATVPGRGACCADLRALVREFLRLRAASFDGRRDRLAAVENALRAAVGVRRAT